MYKDYNMCNDATDMQGRTGSRPGSIYSQKVLKTQTKTETRYVDIL